MTTANVSGWQRACCRQQRVHAHGRECGAQARSSASVDDDMKLLGEHQRHHERGVCAQRLAKRSSGPGSRRAGAHSSNVLRLLTRRTPRAPALGRRRPAAAPARAQSRTSAASLSFAALLWSSQSIAKRAGSAAASRQERHTHEARARVQWQEQHELHQSSRVRAVGGAEGRRDDERHQVVLHSLRHPFSHVSRSAGAAGVTGSCSAARCAPGALRARERFVVAC